MNTWSRKWIGLLRWSEKYLQTDMVYVMHGGLWLLAGRIGLFLVFALMMVAFGNLLPQETYGIYQYVLAILGFLTVFSLPGLHTALIRSIARKKEGSLSLIVKTRLKWALLGSIGMLVISVWYFLQEQTLLGAAFAIGGLFLPLYTVLSVFDAYWNGKKRFDVKTKYELTVAFLAAIFIIPTLFFTNNILIILVVFFASYALFNGLFLWQTLKKTENTEVDKEVIGLGKHISVMAAIISLAEYVDKIIVWMFLGPVQLAIYSFALQPLQRLINLNPIGPLSMPKVSEKDVNTIQEGLMQKFFKGLLITIPFGIGLALLAPVVYPIFFPQYGESVIYFQVLSLLIMMTPFALLNTALVVKARKKELYIIHTTKSATKIGLYLALVPFLGLWGVVVGQVVGAAMGNTLLLYFFTTSSRQTTLPSS